MAIPRLAMRRRDFDSPEHLALALERLAAGDPDAGFKLLLEACRRYPADPIGAHFLGIYYYQPHRFDEASVQF